MAKVHVQVVAHEDFDRALTPAQKEAIAEGCFDGHGHYRVVPTLPELLAQSGDPHTLLILDPPTLLNACDSHGFQPNEKTIICNFNRHTPLLAERSDILAHISFLVGMAVPGLVRPSIASIVEHFSTGRPHTFFHRAFQSEELHLIRKRLKHSTERLTLQDWVEQFFGNEIAARSGQFAIGTSSLPNVLAMILDELLMNAIWDASAARTVSDRTIGVELDAEEFVLIDSLAGGSNMGIAVKDSHGSFPRSSWPPMLAYALDSHRRTAVSAGPGGAGIGLKMIMRKVAALAVEIERGHATRVVTVLRGDQSLRDTQQQPLTMLFFEDMHPRKPGRLSKCDGTQE